MHNVAQPNLTRLDNDNLDNKMRINILKAAKKLFLKNGYQKTTVRQIVKEAKTSTGNFYFYFPDKLSILKIIAQEFILILRNQIDQVKSFGFSPEIGFAFDFRLGYIKTLEDPKLSQLWYIIKSTPEINTESLENKTKRLKTFFGSRIPEQQLKLLAIAIQGISDGITQQKREGTLSEDPVMLSNIIVEYSLRLLGYSPKEIKNTLKQIDQLIKQKQRVLNELDEFSKY
jgi:AcrR family transcriptional regulator